MRAASPHRNSARSAPSTSRLALALTLTLGSALVALSCAGGGAAVAVGNDARIATAPVDAPVDAAAEPSASAAPPNGVPSANETPEEAALSPPVVDPAVQHALLAKTGEASGVAPLGLRFEIVELGAELPWAFALVNRGTESVQVDFDARLLTLEITLPEAAAAPRKAKPPKAVTCRLPPDIVPNAVDPALSFKLEPGAGLAQNFDPRLYCLGKAESPLVEGAVVNPRFGWAPKMKVTWRAGKREEAPATQSEPFVAEPIEAPGSLPAQNSESAERRLKQLSGTALTLGSDFANAPRASKNGDRAEPLGLTLTVSGSDAMDEAAATATTTFTNRGKQKQQLYFRRELITYEISGPDGIFECDPEPDRRSPDPSAFQTLRPSGRLSAVSRLIEMCPAHTFARPGLYLVHARFDAVDAGTAFGLHAFMGRLVSERPALVRVRKGELPFTPGTSTERIHVGE